MKETLLPHLRNLAILALFAFSLAMLTNAAIGFALKVDPARLAALRSVSPAQSGEPRQPGDATEKPATPPRAAPRLATLTSFMKPIVDRNLFDAANALAGVKETEPEPGDPTDEAQLSEIDAVLVSASPAFPQMYSTALINVADATDVYSIGEQFLDAKITNIRGPFLDRNGNHRPARVEFLRANSLEYIEVGGKAKKSKIKKTAGNEDKRKRRSSRMGKHEFGVKKTGDNEYAVPRKDVDYVLGNLDKFARQARVVPNFADGESNGFKVFSIRRNSVLRDMGLKNNDVLSGINGNSLADPSKAMELFGRLQSETSFELEILRNGQPTTLRYDIQ